MLGDWRVHILECGRLSLDGGAMFGSVPRALWERHIAPDDRHRIPLAMRLLLLEHADGARVLVDTGVGDKYDDRFRDMFKVRNPVAVAGRTPLETVVAAAGTAPEAITHVVVTHLHFDHGGGVSRRAGSHVEDSDVGGSGVEPVFPGAEHFLQARNLETARQPNARERASYLPANVEVLSAVPLGLLDGACEILPGLSVIPSEGHTAGMQVVRPEGGGQVVYYVADLSPTRHHVHLPYSMGYDQCARQVLEEKSALWPRVVEEDAVVVFEHDPVFAAGTIGRDRKGRFEVTQQVEFEPPP